MKYLLAFFSPTVFAGEQGFFSSWDIFWTYCIDLLGFGISGLSLSIIVIGVLFGVSSIRKLVFPFIDELWRITTEWTQHKNNLDAGRESHFNMTEGEGQLMIACAVATGLVMTAIFGLLTKLIIPLAGTLGG